GFESCCKYVDVIIHYSVIIKIFQNFTTYPHFMKIIELQIKNFRLLKDVHLSLDKQTTVIVGRNNSGKTSLTELTRRLLGDEAPSFRLEDFSLAVHDQFWDALKLYSEGASEDAVRESLPTIEVRFEVQYDVAATTLGALSEFIIDLDANSDKA